MDKDSAPDAPETSMSDWKQLFEAVLLEDDPFLFPERLENAKNAIVDEIEVSFDTASSSERLLLLAALNTISGLFEGDLHHSHSSRVLGHSA
jgi:hypothetical protein